MGITFSLPHKTKKSPFPNVKRKTSQTILYLQKQADAIFPFLLCIFANTFMLLDANTSLKKFHHRVSTTASDFAEGLDLHGKKRAWGDH